MTPLWSEDCGRGEREGRVERQNGRQREGIEGKRGRGIKDRLRDVWLVSPYVPLFLLHVWST